MKKLLIAIAAVLVTAATYGQGQVVFANRVGAANIDAPVTVQDSNPLAGPGSGFSAQLYLVGAGGALTPLTPISTFRDKTGTTGAGAVADRYWINQTVDVPVAPGTDADFRVRAWATSAGSYDNAAQAGRGESAIFKVTVGGGTLPPGNMGTLANGVFTPTIQPFSVTIIPEPSIIALGVLGAAAFVLRRRK